ncbi:MAG: response regulator [Chromatiaceae bacterium]|nr:MAG: response regulator [Chromatiaceae bacterium]
MDPAGAPRLLLVEDDLPLGQMLCWEFEERGYVAAVAASDGEARQLALAGGFHCALIDLLLLDGNGYELACQLLAQDPGLRVILCSGSQWPGRTTDLGAQILAFLTKPIDIDLVDRLFRIAATPGGPATNDAASRCGRD